MNKKVIYVDFVLKKKKVPSGIFHFLSYLTIRFRIIINGLLHKKALSDNNIREFRKIL